MEKVRVFIGSGEASRLERKTLIHSLQKNSKRDLEIFVLNGTHNAIEKLGSEPVPAPMPLDIKYRNVTEFSLYRHIIPEFCNFQGKAIYIDSDMVVLQDIGELFDTPLNGHQFLAKQDAYGDTKLWGLSVMLIDCATYRPDLREIFAEIDRGDYTLNDFSNMSPKFLKKHPYHIGTIDPDWNVFDFYNANTKLIHYTDLLTQPWKFPNHPYGDIWYQYLEEAKALGIVDDYDIYLSKVRAYVRQDVMSGNYRGIGGLFARLRRFLHPTTKSLKKLLRRVPGLESAYRSIRSA